MLPHYQAAVAKRTAELPLGGKPDRDDPLRGRSRPDLQVVRVLAGDQGVGYPARRLAVEQSDGLSIGFLSVPSSRDVAAR
jgi:hypothetical protein